jgi:hypothetical protein
MVGHQAIGVNLTAQFGFPLSQIVEIIEIISIRAKDYLPVMASLNDMMWAVRKDYS